MRFRVSDVVKGGVVPLGNAIAVMVECGLESGSFEHSPLFRTIEDEQTMNPTSAFKLVETVRQEARFALLAFQNLRVALNEADQERIFLFAHAMAHHAGQVGCFLAPSRASSAARGEFLRAQLKVEGGSPLLMPALRDMLKRAADEGYEDWVGSLEKLDYLEMSVMPQGALAGSSPDVFQRRIDPDSLQFGYRDDSLDLSRLAQELRRFEGACQYWLRGHSPW